MDIVTRPNQFLVTSDYGFELDIPPSFITRPHSHCGLRGFIIVYHVRIYMLFNMAFIFQESFGLTETLRVLTLTQLVLYDILQLVEDLKLPHG